MGYAGDGLPEHGPAAAMRRTGRPQVEYERRGGALRCTAPDGSGAWVDCTPPLRVAMAREAGVTFHLLAPGHDYPITDDPFADLKAHVRSTGLQGTLLCVVDGLPTCDDLADSIEEAKRVFPIVASMRSAATAETVESSMTYPWGKDHEDLVRNLGLSVARGWLEAALAGAAWHDVPFGLRNTVADAEANLGLMIEWDDRTDDAEASLKLLAQLARYPSNQATSLGRLISASARDWDHTTEAARTSLRSR